MQKLGKWAITKKWFWPEQNEMVNTQFLCKESNISGVTFRRFTKRAQLLEFKILKTFCKGLVFKIIFCLLLSRDFNFRYSSIFCCLITRNVYTGWNWCGIIEKWASADFGWISGLMTWLSENRPWLVKIHCCNHQIKLAVKDTLMMTDFKEVDNFYIWT